MTDTDHESLEHVHNKYAHLREEKRRKRQEIESREDLADLIYEGYYEEN